MSEEKATKATSSGFHLPFGCSLTLLDLIAVIYIISHWGEVANGVAHLFQRFGL